MNSFFVNLKRFDIPKEYGGICLVDDLCKCIENIIEDTARFGIGKMDNTSLTYIQPSSGFYL